MAKINWNNKEAVKKYDRERYRIPEVKTRRKKYRDRPEVKARTKARTKKYRSKPEVIAMRKEYEQKPEVKARKKIARSKPEFKDKQKIRDRKEICIICGKPALIKYCSKKCMGIGNSGKNGSNWKGGITPINMIIRGSKEYKLWRTAVFERDDYTCIWCGQRGGRLNADHIKPFALYPELRFAIDNGRTLCEPCHRTTDTYGNKTAAVKYLKDSK